jgi:hypothetical protein
MVKVVRERDEREREFDKEVGGESECIQRQGQTTYRQNRNGLLAKRRTNELNEG